MPDSSPRNGERAVVLGASMAGLLAARVLADAYGQVTVVDRDELPEASAQRRGVPQGRHLHALLSRGQQALEELFPGLTAELVAHGASSGDILGNGRWYVNGHLLRQVRSGLVGVGASRPLLEARVRARVRALPNVAFLDGCDIVGLAATPDGRRVTAARVLRQAGAAEQVLDADLVVDATGRGSRAPVWLEALGYPRPERDEIRVRLGYATRTYRLPADVLGRDIAVLDAPTPQNPRGGALLALEDGRWVVTLAGILGDYPPTDPEGFLAFARSLRFPDIHQAIRDGEPLDDPVPFRFPASVRHRYERLDRFPDGFLVVGDAVCSFNPIYGQGMSVAALEACLLKRLLDRPGQEGDPIAQLAPRFFAEMQALLETPWSVAMLDFVFPDTRGQRPADFAATLKFGIALNRLAAEDPAVHRLTIEVQHLLKPRSVYRDPKLIERVLAKMAEA
jgi:2-polyprenyl-6-methoxyphenol hydroxylase-like FAD-dependent oxidoreductase